MKQTLENLIQAFIGESQARNRYNFYASVARKEGYEQIGAIFALTAEQEKEHAKRIFEHIQELKKEKGEIDEIKVEVAAPLTLGSTQENLLAAIKGEKYEQSQMYPQFAEIAEKEGYPTIAKRLRAIAIAEKHHQERYQKLLDNLKSGRVFHREKPVWWVCRECGYVHFDTEPPQKCPSCDHDRAFYQLKSEEY